MGPVHDAPAVLRCSFCNKALADVKKLIAGPNVMETIKPGMTRKELLVVFTTEGGLSTGLHRTSVSRDCPYFKVDVEFEAVGRPGRNSDGRVTYAPARPIDMTRTALTVLAAGCLGLTVLLQAQSPVFEAAQPIPIGAGSQQLTLIDTNGDNHLDLVVSRYQHGIAVLLGNGRGQFSPAPFDSQTRTGKSIDLNIEPAAIAIGDVVADSQPDLVVAFRDKANEYLQVFHGDGHGRFGPGGTKRYETSTSFEFYKPAIQLADVDGNGWLDIITSNGRRNTIEILLANARGGSSAAFTPGPTISLTPHSTFWTFGVGDFDADGRVDLLTTFNPEGEASGRVEIRKGLGHGLFQEPSGGVSLRPGARIAAVADLNGDSRPDAVLSHVDTGWVSVLLNDGKGSLAHAPQSPRDLGLQTYGIVVSDINRDRRADIVVTTVNSRVRPYESRVAVLLGDGLAAAAGSPFPVGYGAYHLSAGDVNEDGKMDVVTSSFETDSISVLLGR